MLSDGLPHPEGHAVDDSMIGPPEQCVPPRYCHYANLVNFFYTLVFRILVVRSARQVVRLIRCFAGKESCVLYSPHKILPFLLLIVQCN